MRLGRYISLSVVFLFAIAAFSLSQEKSDFTIAVLDFQANGVPEAESKSLSGSTRVQTARLVGTDTFQKKTKVRYTVVERSQMDKIFEQFQIQDTGCTDISCAVEFGKMLGVERIVIGSVGLVGETYTINASIVDVETSKSLRVAEYKHRGERDVLLNKGVPDIVSQLLYGKKLGVSHKKYYFLAGAVIAGGAAAYLSTQGGGNGSSSGKPSGTITIVIPDPSE